jgi:serine/threonine protein kinase
MLRNTLMQTSRQFNAPPDGRCTYGLRSLLLQEGTLDRRQQLELAVDCARGLDFLHNGDDENPRLNGPIIHNDLKSFNVLVRANDRTEKPFVAKLADLEFAQDDGPSVARGGDRAQFARTQSMMMRPPPVPDTVNWTAPELMRVGEEGWPTVESDAWALGMLIFEIFALEIPFAEGQCTIDLKHTLERQQEAAANAGADAEAALEATVAPPFFGRAYLICRICDGGNPLRPPLCGDSTGRPSLVPPDVSTLLAACWADDPSQRLSPRSMKESLHTLVRSAPQRLSGLESLRGVGLPKVPELRPRYRTGATALKTSLSGSLTSEDGLFDTGGNDDARASQESEDSVTMTDFEARGKFGVGTLATSGRNRPRQISERGVGLPAPRALGKIGSGAPQQDPTGFGNNG